MQTRLLSTCVIALPLLLVTSTFAEDWPQWRGPSRNAKSAETGLLEKWPEDGPPLAWKASGVGGGFASLSVDNGVIYTLGDLEDGSYVIALSESTGDQIWKTRIGDAGGGLCAENFDHADDGSQQP